MLNYANRSRFLRVLRSHVRALSIPLDQQVLIVGGSVDDEAVLRHAGFTRIVNSNLPSDISRITNGKPGICESHATIDVEQMDLPDESFDLVFAHAVLHHCRSPHRALCEMLRVSRKYVIFLEPNDSLAMSALVRLRFSFPYELFAVADHDYRSGGVRDSAIPNFIYRWSKWEVSKTISSFLPERAFSVRTYPYWDFSMPENELAMRTETRIGSVTSVLGVRNFMSALRVLGTALNWVPVLRKQGNKFFCCVEKGRGLKSWLMRDGNTIVFNREFGRRKDPAHRPFVKPGGKPDISSRDVAMREVDDTSREGPPVPGVSRPRTAG